MCSSLNHLHHEWYAVQSLLAARFLMREAGQSHDTGKIVDALVSIIGRSQVLLSRFEVFKRAVIHEPVFVIISGAAFHDDVWKGSLDRLLRRSI